MRVYVMPVLISWGFDRNNEKDMHGLMAGNFCFFDAPAVIFLCMDRNLTHWSLFDLGALSQSIMLSACEYGLGTAVAVQLASYPDLVRQELGIPDNLSVCIGIAIGYADPSSSQNAFRSGRKMVVALSFSFISGDRIMMNRQGWIFEPEGARRAAANIS